MVRQYRLTFKGKNQLPLAMLYYLDFEGQHCMEINEPYFGRVLFMTDDLFDPIRRKWFFGRLFGWRAN